MLELRRKVFHVVSILLLAIPVEFFPFWVNLIIFPLGLILNLLVILKVQPFYGVFEIFIKLFERERNLNTPGIQSLWALLGVFTSYLLFGKESIAGIFVLALGDGFSGLVGHYLGKRKLFYNSKKSLEGTIAFFVASFLGLLFIADFSKALIISLVCAIFESLPLKLDDNFYIPTLASFLGEVL